MNELPYLIEVDARTGKPIPVDALPDELLDEYAAGMGWTPSAPEDAAAWDDQRKRVRRGLRMLRAEARKAQRRSDSKETRS